MNPGTIRFEVRGVPAPGGSKTVQFPRRGGKIQYRAGSPVFFVRDDAGKKNTDWRRAVASACRVAMNGAPPLGGPLSLRVVFWMPRPKSLRRGRAYPAVRPDATKLLRATEDALTGIAWRDDAQVCEQAVSKRYADDGRCGATIEISNLPAVPPAPTVLALPGSEPV